VCEFFSRVWWGESSQFSTQAVNHVASNRVGGLLEKTNKKKEVGEGALIWGQPLGGQKPNNSKGNVGEESIEEKDQWSRNGG